MYDKKFRFDSDVDGLSIQAYVWETANPKAVVVISHGAAEHSLRYDRFARALNEAGIDAYALDHRGHGQSPGPGGLGDFGEGGWDALVDDIEQFVGLARSAYNDLPVVLFGHSMGSAAAQQYAWDRSRTIDALILSGSSARMSTRRETREGEERQPNSNLNRTFEGRTDYDWLSRDQTEVDKYIADPLCGFESRDPKFRGMSIKRRPGGREVLKNIRNDLPCLFVAGDKDPVNNNLEGLYRLEELWREAGVERIDRQYYEGGRHEMLNEINRDEVTQNIIDWIKDVLDL